MKGHELDFYKYQGCGNDFIILDNRKNNIQLKKETIFKWCHRRFGIGADGLMLLSLSQKNDFSMQYYNSDGNESSFCGNGGRCIAQFAKDIGVVEGNQTSFEFKNNIYRASFLAENTVSLCMQDVEGIATQGKDLYFCTGSPHYIHFVNGIDEFDLIPYARSIRYSEKFPRGINVNLVEILGENTLKMRTYERGVEDETYSCGTGVTAAAIALHFAYPHQYNTTRVETKGGNFQVKFKYLDNKYIQIELIGKAEFVYKGKIDGTIM